MSLVSDLEHKRDLLLEHARVVPHVDVWETPASFYSFWDIRDALGRRTAEGRVLSGADDVAAWLCETAGVVTASGTGFAQEGYLRLAFDIPDEEIVAGMRAARLAFGGLS